MTIADLDHVLDSVVHGAHTANRMLAAFAASWSDSLAYRLSFTKPSTQCSFANLEGSTDVCVSFHGLRYLAQTKVWRQYRIVLVSASDT